MKQIIFLLALLGVGWSDVFAAPASTNLAATDRILLIDPSSMPLTAGKATLIVGPLQRTNGVYAGDYKIKVFPYFWKNKNGRLAIVVSDVSLAEINDGKVTAVTGTATTSGKNGKCRHIDATVTPTNRNCGMLKVWFVAEDQKMVFAPAYCVVEKGTSVALAQTTEIHP
jgi:hypothetical protein